MKPGNRLPRPMWKDPSVPEYRPESSIYVLMQGRYPLVYYEDEEKATKCAEELRKEFPDLEYYVFGIRKATHTRKEIQNQCDGCNAEMPLKEGIHYYPEDVPFMVCTSEKYKENKDA